MKRLLYSAAAALAALIPASSAHAYINAYLKIQGSKTSNFNPTVPSGFYRIELEDAKLAAIVSPRDPASGQATGKRTHKPLRARMYYDQSLPNLIKTAFAAKEPLRSAVLQIFQPLPNGQVKLIREIQLGAGYINAYNAPTQTGGPHVVEFRFVVIGTRPLQKVQGANAFKQNG